MRFSITLTRTGKQRMLPIDYQYYLSAWIYKVIENADPVFADFLHSTGYTGGSHQFKLFCYSPLELGKPTLWKEKALLELNTDTVYLQVSFLLPEAAEKFIVGLFKSQSVYLGDRFNGIDLLVSSIEHLPEPAFTEKVRYRAISPVVISFLPEGKKYSTYLAPDNGGYKDLLTQHLNRKYQSIPGVDPSFGFNLVFSLLNTPRSKLVTIKPYSPQQSKVRGYLFNFDLTAPPEIHRMIYSSGFAEKNSTGFGWVEPIDTSTSVRMK